MIWIQLQSAKVVSKWRTRAPPPVLLLFSPFWYTFEGVTCCFVQSWFCLFLHAFCCLFIVSISCQQKHKPGSETSECEGVRQREWGDLSPISTPYGRLCASRAGRIERSEDRAPHILLWCLHFLLPFNIARRSPTLGGLALGGILH